PRELAQRIGPQQVLLREYFWPPAIQRAASLGHFHARVVLAAQQAVFERKIGQERHAQLFAFRQHVLLGVPREQAVVVLNADEPRGAFAGRRSVRGGSGGGGSLGVVHHMRGEV